MVSGICLMDLVNTPTGWQNVGGTWYYLHGNGVMASKSVGRRTTMLMVPVRCWQIHGHRMGTG